MLPDSRHCTYMHGADSVSTAPMAEEGRRRIVSNNGSHMRAEICSQTLPCAFHHRLWSATVQTQNVTHQAPAATARAERRAALQVTLTQAGKARECPKAGALRTQKDGCSCIVPLVPHGRRSSFPVLDSPCTATTLAQSKPLPCVTTQSDGRVAWHLQMRP